METRKYKEIATLLIYFVVYWAVTFAMIYGMNSDQSGSIGYVIFYFPVFWAVAGILLFLMIKLMKIPINNFGRMIIVFLSTPLPLIMYLLCE